MYMDIPIYSSTYLTIATQSDINYKRLKYDS